MPAAGLRWWASSAPSAGWQLCVTALAWHLNMSQSTVPDGVMELDIQPAGLVCAWLSWRVQGRVKFIQWGKSLGFPGQKPQVVCKVPIKIVVQLGLVPNSNKCMSCHACEVWQDALLLGSGIRFHHDLVLTSSRGWREHLYDALFVTKGNRQSQIFSLYFPQRNTILWSFIE